MKKNNHELPCLPHAEKFLLKLWPRHGQTARTDSNAPNSYGEGNQYPEISSFNAMKGKGSKFLPGKLLTSSSVRSLLGP